MEEIDIDMKEKVVMITGANSGIGKETAIALAKMGATIVMVCRNQERGEHALQEIKEKSNSDNVILFLADLADQESIRKVVDDFKEKYKELHVLINNAGLVLMKKMLTPEGYESTFAINHLGHFLLTNLLLDIIKESAPSRIINVSSVAHSMARLDLEDIHFENEKYRGFRSYGNSKLATILFTYELARKLEGTGVTVNALHPGGVRTNFGKRHSKWYIRPIMSLFSVFMINAKKGARTSVYLASSPEVEETTGKYFKKCEAVESSKISYDESIQQRLWELSEKLVKLNETEKGWLIKRILVSKI